MIFFYLLNHVRPLMKHLFNHPGTVIASKKDNTLRLMYWSKAIFSFHSEVLGLPVGEKKFVLRIPNPVMSLPKNVQACCIRGLVDTDGTLTFKQA